MALTYQVVITPDAQQSIQEITGYLMEKVSIETALKVNDAIVNTIKNLKTFPERNDVAENVSKRNVIYRRIMAMSYRIVYTIDKEEVQVIVVDVDYGARSDTRIKRKLQ